MNELFLVVFIVIAVLVTLIVIGSIFSKKDNSNFDEIRIQFNNLLKKNIENKYLVIELDKLLESALKIKFNMNSGIGEILKTKAGSLSKSELNEIWFAHKIRNKLVHDINFSPDRTELQIAIKNLKKAIKETIK